MEPGAKSEEAVSIAEFRADHIPRVVSLWEETEHVGLSGADEPAALARFLDRNPGLSFVAVRLHDLVGAVLCGDDGRRGYIHHLAVAESHRRTGLGARLLGSCLDALQGVGIEKCHAFVFHHNPFAELFWGRRGWLLRNDLLLQTHCRVAA